MNTPIRAPLLQSTEDRLTEVAALLAEAILRHRVRAFRRSRNSARGRENGLDVLAETRTDEGEQISEGAGS